MKRRIALFIAIMLICAGCAGCGGKGSSKKEYTIDVSELSSELKNGIAFEDELNECRDAIFFKKYTIDTEDVVKQSTYFSTNATTEEISIVECTDSKAAERVKAAFDSRVSEQKSVFESYAPDEIARLDGAVVMTLGKYAILCVTAEPDKAQEIIKKYE